jgi:putative lipoic acid-binding regulatory protein
MAERLMDSQADHRPSVELLESTHLFPGVYRIKAIGRSEGDFQQRIVDAVVSLLAAPSDLDYSVRSTPGGRHVALTLDISVQTAEQVRSIYAEIREIEGLTLLF